MKTSPVYLYPTIQTDDVGYAIVKWIDCRDAGDDIWVIKPDSQCF